MQGLALGVAVAAATVGDPQRAEHQPYCSRVIGVVSPGAHQVPPQDDEKVRERIHDIGERIVAEHGEALQILADHDPDISQP